MLSFLVLAESKISEAESEMKKKKCNDRKEIKLQKSS